MCGRFDPQDQGPDTPDAGFRSIPQRRFSRPDPKLDRMFQSLLQNANALFPEDVATPMQESTHPCSDDLRLRALPVFRIVTASRDAHDSSVLGAGSVTH
jgi:hypothetical protein